MNRKVEDAHSFIGGRLVARMVMNFHREFDGIYGTATMASDLCAVGPLQSMIGIAIKSGYLRLTDRGFALQAEEAKERKE